MKRTLIAVAIVLGVLRPMTAQAHIGTHEVTIKDLQFTPYELKVDPGEVVTWQALEKDHTVSSDDGAFDSGRTLNQGDTFTWQTPATDGRFSYHCNNHSSMRGVIVVGNPPPPPPPPPVPTIRVPDDAPTLASALEQATDGTHVVLATGLHLVDETAEVPEGVTVRADEGAAAVVEPSKSAIDPVIRLAGDNTHLRGFVIRKGKNVAVAVDGVRHFRIESMGLIAEGAEYGIRASGSRFGSIRRVDLSGYRTAGIHVSRCGDCDTVVESVTVSNSHRGYEQRHAGGTAILRSRFMDNEAGIVLREPFDDDGSIHRGSHVYANSVTRTPEAQPPRPRLPDGRLTVDAGILVSGGWQNVLESNRISGHRYGALLTGLSGPTHANRVVSNEVAGTRSGLAYDGIGMRDCFSANRAPDGATPTSDPVEIQSLYSCDAPLTVGVVSPPVVLDVVTESRRNG